jgi:hypothetical protein
MIGLLALLIAMLVPVGIGWCVLRLAVPGGLRRKPGGLRREPLEQVFLGGFLGLVLLTAQMFAYSLAAVPRSFPSLVLPWIVVLGAAGVVRALVEGTRLKRSGRKGRPPTRRLWRFAWPRLNGLDWVLVVVLAVELFWLATMTVNEPVWGWDTMVNWARKAKIYYYEVQPDYRHLPLPPYPLCVPLAQTWVFDCLGAWNDAVGKGIFMLPFVLGGCGFYAVLKSLTRRTWALAATAALLATPRIFLNLTEGYADAFLALLYGPGVLLLCRWLVRGDHWDLWAGALCLGMTAWIKAEGLPLGLMALVLAVAISLIRQRRWSRELSLAVPIALVLVLLAGVAWQIAARHLDLGAVHGRGVYSFDNFRRQLTGERVSAIARQFWFEVRLFNQWGIIWFVWPVAALASVRRLVRPVPMLLLVTIAADLALILVVFITTGLPLGWHLSAALERLMINVLPLLIALTTIQAYGLFSGEPAVSAREIRDRHLFPEK